MLIPVLALAALSSVVSAHVTVTSPASRGHDGDQTQGPCGGYDWLTPRSVVDPSTNVAIKFADASGTVTIRLGLGDQLMSEFPYVLSVNKINTKGRYQLPMDFSGIPDDAIKSPATIQVISDSHGVLYECIDVTLNLPERQITTTTTTTSTVAATTTTTVAPNTAATVAATTTTTSTTTVAPNTAAITTTAAAAPNTTAITTTTVIVKITTTQAATSPEPTPAYKPKYKPEHKPEYKTEDLAKDTYKVDEAKSKKDVNVGYQTEETESILSAAQPGSVTAGVSALLVAAAVAALV